MSGVCGRGRASGETFTTDGVTITQTLGKKTGLAANAVSCTVTDPFGTATVVRAPVPPRG
jgi:hypothetical protein